jgi:hypothetical protein
MCIKKGLIILVTAFSLPAFAQTRSQGNIYFEETFFPEYVNRNDTTSQTTAPGVATEKGLGYDLRTTIGYLWFAQSFLTGLTFNLYNLKTDRPNVVGADPGLDETTKDNRLGLTLGWLAKTGFRFLGTFFVSGTKEVHTVNFDENGSTGDVKFTHKGIAGFQVTMGYSFQIWGVEIGPSLVYSQVKFKKQSKVNALNSAENYSDTTLFSAKVDAELKPMVSVVALF